MKLRPVWLAALVTLSGAVSAISLTPMQLSYDVAWSGTPLGTGTLTLSAESGDCYRYELATHPIGMVRWLYGSPKETSHFCVQDGVVVPSAMRFENVKRPKDGFALTFDFAKAQVLGGRNGPLPIQAGALDRLSVHQAARLWVKQHVNHANPGVMTVAIADHKRVKSYTFAIKGRSPVITPAGSFDAIRFERIDDPNTTLRFWLAPEKDYMPVKVQNFEEGEDKVSLSLRKD